MKKIMIAFVAFMSLSISAFANSNNGLNVLLTAKDTQTQMMAMVLSMQTLKLGKNVNIVLCSEAANLAVKGEQSEMMKPLNKSPKMLLNGIIKKGANVEVCPLFLPNANLDKTVLIEGVTVAKPPVVAKKLLDPTYTTLSY